MVWSDQYICVQSYQKDAFDGTMKCLFTSMLRSSFQRFKEALKSFFTIFKVLLHGHTTNLIIYLWFCDFDQI